MIFQISSLDSCTCSLCLDYAAPDLYHAVAFSSSELLSSAPMAEVSSAISAKALAHTDLMHIYMGLSDSLPFLSSVTQEKSRFIYLCLLILEVIKPVSQS